MEPDKKSLPFQLEKGLRLEDRGQVLRWGASLKELLKTAPEVGKVPLTGRQPPCEGFRVTLAWQSVTFLGGLQGAATAEVFVFRRCEAKEEVGPEVLREILLAWNGLYDGEPRDGYALAVKALNERFGEPTQHHVDETIGGLPMAVWFLGNIVIEAAVYDRFGEYLKVTLRLKRNR